MPNETAEEKAPTHGNTRKQGCSEYREKNVDIYLFEEVNHQAMKNMIEFRLKILSVWAGEEMLGPGRGREWDVI